MEQWDIDDTISANKANKLSVVKGTTDELNELSSEEISSGSVFYDEIINKLLLNKGTDIARDYQDLDNDIIGSIRISTVVEPDKGWLKCDGSSLSRNDYADLFAVIGVTYGSEDSATFNLPNLIDSKFVRAVNSNARRNEKGGTETVILTVGQLPVHSHLYETLPDNLNLTGHNTFNRGIENTAISGSTGGNQPHNNVPKFLTSVYVIRSN